VVFHQVKAHKKGGVADLAVHPSGRLALTVGRGDSSLVMVNLVRGRKSFSCRIEKEASVVKYGGESGDWFAMASERKITVHSSEDARVVQELDCERNVLCVTPGEVHTVQIVFSSFNMNLVIDLHKIGYWTLY
jgi:protein MAK11